MIRRVVVSLMLAAVLGAGCQSSSDSEAPSSSAASGVQATPSMSEADADKQATQASDAWLKLIDQGKYDDAWDQTGQWLKDHTTRIGWSKQIGAMRTAMGPVLSRNMKQAEYKTKIPEGPGGDYVILHYDTVFKATNQGMEDVTLQHNPDGSWKPLGYYLAIKPSPTIKTNP